MRKQPGARKCGRMSAAPGQTWVAGGGSSSLGLRLALTLMCVLASALPAAAAGLSVLEARLAARILVFQEAPPTGEQRIAIVHAADRPESAAEAAETAQSLRGAEPTGGLRLVPELVSLSDLASLSGVVALVITDSMLDAAPAIAAAAHSMRIPTIARSIDCVSEQRCVIAVQSRPRVRITLSREAATQARVKFQPAVWVMVEAMP